MNGQSAKRPPDDSGPALEMFRANAARNGCYPGAGITTKPALKWRIRTGGLVMSSPAVFPGNPGIVCFGSWDGNLYAADSESGAQLWAFATNGGVVSSPALDSSVVFFSGYDHNIYAVNLFNGRELWRFETRNAVASSPLVTRIAFPKETIGTFPLWRTVAVSCAGMDGFLYFLDPRGKEISRFYAGHPIVSSAAGPVSRSGFSLIDGSDEPALVAVGTGGGLLFAVDMKTGREKWRFKTGGPIDSSPAVDYGAFFFGSNDGCFYAVNASNGAQRWRFRTGRPVRSSAAVWEGTVFFGCCDNCLYAVDIMRGKEKWRFKTHGPVDSSPSVAAGTVYFGGNDRRLYAVDARTGLERWRFETSGSVRTSPVICNGSIYFGSDDGCMYALG